RAEMFRFAASYFADPEAQYYLGRLYLLGKGAPKPTRAITAPRLCSAACCSRAKKFRAKPRSRCSGSLLRRTPQARTRPGLRTCTPAPLRRLTQRARHGPQSGQDLALVLGAACSVGVVDQLQRFFDAQ